MANIKWEASLLPAALQRSGLPSWPSPPNTYAPSRREDTQGRSARDSFQVSWDPEPSTTSAPEHLVHFIGQ